MSNFLNKFKLRKKDQLKINAPYATTLVSPDPETGELRVEDRALQPDVGMYSILSLNDSQILVQYTHKLRCNVQRLNQDDSSYLYVKPKPGTFAVRPGTSFTLFVGNTHFVAMIVQVLDPASLEPSSGTVAPAPHPQTSMAAPMTVFMEGSTTAVDTSYVPNAHPPTLEPSARRELRQQSVSPLERQPMAHSMPLDPQRPLENVPQRMPLADNSNNDYAAAKRKLSVPVEEMELADRRSDVPLLWMGVPIESDPTPNLGTGPQQQHNKRSRLEGTFSADQGQQSPARMPYPTNPYPNHNHQDPYNNFTTQSVIKSGPNLNAAYNMESNQAGTQGTRGDPNARPMQPVQPVYVQNYEMHEANHNTGACIVNAVPTPAARRVDHEHEHTPGTTEYFSPPGLVHPRDQTPPPDSQAPAMQEVPLLVQRPLNPQVAPRRGFRDLSESEQSQNDLGEHRDSRERPPPVQTKPQHAELLMFSEFGAGSSLSVASRPPQLYPRHQKLPPVSSQSRNDLDKKYDPRLDSTLEEPRTARRPLLAQDPALATSEIGNLLLLRERVPTEPVEYAKPASKKDRRKKGRKGKNEGKQKQDDQQHNEGRHKDKGKQKRRPSEHSQQTSPQLSLASPIPSYLREANIITHPPGERLYHNPAHQAPPQDYSAEPSGRRSSAAWATGAPSNQSAELSRLPGLSRIRLLPPPNDQPSIDALIGQLPRVGHDLGGNAQVREIDAQIAERLFSEKLQPPRIP